MAPDANRSPGRHALGCRGMMKRGDDDRHWVARLLDCNGVVHLAPPVPISGHAGQRDAHGLPRLRAGHGDQGTLVEPDESVRPHLARDGHGLNAHGCSSYSLNPARRTIRPEGRRYISSGQMASTSRPSALATASRMRRVVRRPLMTSEMMRRSTPAASAISAYETPRSKSAALMSAGVMFAPSGVAFGCSWHAPSEWSRRFASRVNAQAIRARRLTA